MLTLSPGKPVDKAVDYFKFFNYHPLTAFSLKNLIVSSLERERSFSDGPFMKKLMIWVLAMMLFVVPASAQQAGRSSRASKANANVARLLNAYNRMNLANKQAGVNAPSSPANNAFNSFSDLNPVAPGAESSDGTSIAVSGDRPFDSNAAAVNPFGQTGPFSIVPSNPPATFGPGVDVLSPGPLTVNPFLPSNPWEGVSVPANPGNGTPATAMSQAKVLNTTRNVPNIRKPAPAQVRPMEGLSKKDASLTSNPFKSIAAFDLPSIYVNPYSSYSPLPNSALQPSLFP